MHRGALRRLRVVGAGKTPAEISFHRTLTFLTGASNTGKSHIFSCLDFCLGGATPEHDFDEARGYDHALLELGTNGDVFTVRRTFGQENVALWFTGPMDDWDDALAEELPVPADRTQPLKTLGGRLMSAFGFDPSMSLVKNQSGKTQVLSFRSISNMFLVSEEDVISRRSLILPAVPFNPTANRSAFNLMISGKAPTDEEIAQLRAAHQATERASQQIAALEPLIDDLRSEIAEARQHRDELEQEIAQIDEQLGELSEVVAASGDAVRGKLHQRNDALRASERERQRKVRNVELRNRFELLAEHYASDTQRLEFALESGHFFQQLEASHCPRCGRPLDNDAPCHPETDDFAAIEHAARAEIAKLAPRMSELQTTIADVEQDAANASAEQQRWDGRAAALDREIREVANPTATEARARVRGLANRRRELEQHLLRFRELDRYLAIKQEADLIKRRGADTFRPEQDAASLRSLQEQIRNTLSAWRLPAQSDVIYDVRAGDLVIDSKARAANGKGVRAVTHAAFTVALMRHCFARETPHAGFVAIDSPLTPYRGSTDDEEVDLQAQEDVHAACLNSLASTPNAGQTVIIDNIDPPDGLHAHAEVVVFTGPDGHGRSGFYPVQ